jgi:hypothetical protein
MAALDGAGFRSADVDPLVRHFYEHTADWRMEVWAQWSAVFQPGGELISRLFGKRVQQLALPTRPLDVAHGMDSRVVHLVDSRGAQKAAGWLRTLSATGEFVYSGCYSTRLLDAHTGRERPDVAVVSGLPAIPQLPLATSSTTHQVTGRMFSPSICTIASVSRRMISSFCSGENTFSITFTWINGISRPPLCTSADRRTWPQPPPEPRPGASPGPAICIRNR